MIVNVAKLSNALNLLFLVRLCIATSMMFLSINLAALPVKVFTLTTHSNMINCIITMSRGNILVTTKAMENNIDLVCKTNLIKVYQVIIIQSIT